MHNIYLDNNATTKILPEVWDYMGQFNNNPLNPSSVHSFGRESRKMIEKAKNMLCESLGIDKSKYRIVFTSSGTETNNWIIKYLPNLKVLVSITEHVSILSAREDLKLIDVDCNGLINLEMLENELQNHEKSIVSVMYANNETGVIQDLAKIREITSKYNALLHSDMVQAIGKVSINFKDLDLDAFTISSHKIHGPQGVAALFVKRDVPLSPMLLGGGQNQGLRAGTENTLGIMGMAKAVEIAIKNLDEFKNVCGNYQDFIENEILNNKGAKIISRNARRLPNTSLIYMPEVSNETQLISFDMAGIGISSGSACSSGKIAPSHVLIAQGLSEKDAKCVIRCSTSRFTQKHEIEKFVSVWKEIYNNKVNAEGLCQ